MSPPTMCVSFYSVAASALFLCPFPLWGQLTNEQIMEHLERMRATQTGMMNIAPAEGEYLAGLVKQLQAKSVLEIGTSNGYSAIWLAMGLRATGGRLITLEIDKRRYQLARDNFQATGLESIIESRLIDALEEIPRLAGPFDLVFIDAWKPDYVRYLELTLPKVRSGGVIAAHNVESHAEQLGDFLQLVRTKPELKTEFARKGSGGLSVSYKIK